MLAPRHIQKELRNIDNMYFATFNSHVKSGMSAGEGRWQVRKWLGVYPRRLDLWATDMSEAVMTISKEEVTDRGLVDAGYQEISIVDVDAIRESHWWKLDWKKKIAAMDWGNEKKERFANDELDYQSKYVAKKIWRMRHEPTVHLSGKEWKV